LARLEKTGREGMKQVAQRPRDGLITVVEAPLPALRPGWILVANRCSLISSGTERSTVELGGKNLMQKARARPDLVGKLVERARAEGIRSAVTAARERLGALSSLGYSSAGVVLRVGAGVKGIVPGDRVACGGGGFANHAEVIVVPRNLVASVPDEVAFESAAYATIGAIALHGVRRAEAQVGESIGVIGLGLVGQLAVRILAAAGCRPVGVDLNPQAVALAAESGAAFERSRDGLEQAVLEATGGLGLDAVLVCAASRSSDPLDLAIGLARERGRIVVVGDVAIEADRSSLYEKELELRLSRSYGPGRYDRDYEEGGRDLPPAYVRWTEQRNLEAFLELVATGRVDPSRLTTHRFPVEEAEQAYGVLTGENEQRPFGILLEYEYEYEEPKRDIRPPTVVPGVSAPRVGVIGAGSFARSTLIPALRDAGAELVSVTSEGGLSAADVASRFGFERAAASADELLSDGSLDAVVIATRHSSHASLAAAALRAGKAVFVEKPLALDEDGLLEVEEALSGGALLMVGFNRRYAPLVERLRDALEGVQAPALLARVNAGPLPDEHWLNDAEEGGGRLLGEGCHFVDLLAYLTGSPATSVHAMAIPRPGRPLECSDDIVATLRFATGGVATLLYSGAGDARLPKERIEAFGGGLAAVLDDFRRLELYRGGKRRLVKSRQDKGHRREIEHFVRALAGEVEPPPVESYIASTRATLALVDSLRSGQPVELS
jgi:predicted dehydrogenase/threonine dehydrogenase-like Zn-dependent dehydrogenase